MYEENNFLSCFLVKCQCCSESLHVMLLYQAWPNDTDNRASFKVLKETIEYLMKLHSSSDTVARNIDFNQSVDNSHGDDCGCLQAKHC